ncbi:MAG: DUF885 domain-containing protein, partial [Acidobacteria bacterium]|nr:DUF885 domain-containing protein [Acidobacteriota bacterium]
MLRRSVLAVSIPVFTIFIFGVLLNMPERSYAESEPSAGRSWIERSDKYTNMLLEVVFKHHPEFGSREGLSEYDGKISEPSWADHDLERRETRAVLEKLKTAAREEQQKEVRQDLA